MRIGSLELRREDFPDLSTGERTDRLLRQLNRFGTEAGGALDHGLTFADNFAAEVRTVEIATKDDTAPWTAPSYAAGHSASSYTPGFRHVGDRVEMRGTVSVSGTASGALMFTLPAEDRPLQLARFAVPITATPTTGLVTVDTNGEVRGYYSGGATFYAIDQVAFASTARSPSPNPAFPVRLKSGIVPSLIFAGAAWDVTDRSETPATLGPVAWSRSSKGDEIVIADIGGVYANRKYRVKLVIAAG